MANVSIHLIFSCDANKQLSFYLSLLALDASVSPEHIFPNCSLSTGTCTLPSENHLASESLILSPESFPELVINPTRRYPHACILISRSIRGEHIKASVVQLC